MQSFTDPIMQWSITYKINIAISFLIIFCYLVLRRIAIPKIEYHIKRDEFKSDLVKRASAILTLFSGIIAVAIVLFVWGFDFKGLLALSTGLIALTGAALFASWSILSNITSFFLILTQQSYRQGNFIRIIDADNYIDGYIAEINLFNTKLISENQEIIIYPNNLITSRPTIINPKKRYSTVGKTTEFASKSTEALESNVQTRS